MDVKAPWLRIDKAQGDALLERLLAAEQQDKTAISHLRTSLMDWNVEEQWHSQRAAAVQLDGLGYMFITFTKKEPRHCTLRHFFVLQEARGTGVGRRMMKQLNEHCLRNGVRYLRFFADKKAIGFYERLGYAWHGVGKSGLPLTYWNIAMAQLAPLPASQRRHVVSRTLRSLTLDRRQQ